MPSCAVALCKNSFLSKSDRGNELSFHRFPKKYKAICKVWISKCKQRDKVNVASAVICSDHFLAEDYERDLKNELLGLPLAKRLKVDAVPSIFSRDVDEVSKGKQDDRKKRLAKRCAKKLVDSILLTEESRQHEGLDENLSVEHDGWEHPVELSNSLESEEVRTLNEKIKLLEAQVNKQSNLIAQQTRVISRQKKIIALTPHPDASSTPIFSTAQHKKLNGLKRVNWNNTDIAKALIVRSISTKAYAMTQTQWNLPLPAVRTLQTWARKFDCSEGVLTDVLNILKGQAVHMDILSRLSVLVFDEMSVDSAFILDPTFDRICNFSKVQVVMLRGLCSDWKQPIFYNFDTDMTKDLIMNIITKAEDCGFFVCSIVCDLGPENRSFLNSLHIDLDNVKFTNPVDNNRHVYVFADVPHCLKNVRNHLLDDGVILEDGTVLDKSVLEEMAQKSNNGEHLKLCPSLTIESLNIKGPERMRVKPAAQLLSQSVATLAQTIFPNKPSIFQFFETLNNGFDALNSSSSTQSNPLKHPFTSSDDQTEALIYLKDLLTTIKFRTKQGNEKRVMLPCQRGFIISIKSIFQLYTELKLVYNIQEICTRKLNQDCLESFFSIVRSMGGANTQPSPPEFRFRLRLIILGSKTRPPTGSNVEDEDISYLSSQLLRKNNLHDYCVPESNVEIIDQDEDAMPINIPEAEEESLKYVAVVVAQKLQKLGIHNYSSSTNVDATLVKSSWLSKGGSSTTDSALLDTVKRCELLFKKYFPLLQRCRFISKTLVHKISLHDPSIDKTLLDIFIKIRLRIKIRSLNENKKHDKSQRLKMNHFIRSSNSHNVYKRTNVLKQLNKM